MKTCRRSIFLWAAGALAGAALSKERPITGAALGALLVGGIGDKVLENRGLCSAGDDVVDRPKVTAPA